MRRSRLSVALLVLAGLLLVGGCDLLAPNGPPTAAIERPTAGAVLDADSTAVFEGSASDPEDGELAGEALRWTSSVDGSLGSGTAVAVSGLSLGAHDVLLVATDSEGSADTATVRVEVNAAPSAVIAEPSDGTVFNEGEQANFAGSATDPEDGGLSRSSLVWTSDVDGLLGTGERVRRPGMSPGPHVVVLTATDSHGFTGVDTVRVRINPAPEVTILTPADGSAFEEGETIVLTGGATDEESGAVEGDALVWTSSEDGEIGRGETVTGPELSPGIHTITLSATDARGAVGTASIRVAVGVTTLSLGEAVTDIGAPRGGQRHFAVRVPAGDAIRLRFLLTGGSGDADLYVRRGRYPARQEGEFDCASANPGNEDSCTFDEPADGTWFVLLYAFSAFDGAALLAELESPTDDCSLGSPDADGDRLPDCAETGTGVFVNALDTGTDPANHDTDLDGLGDGDEVLGTLAGLDLPAFGVSPLRKDILMEYDWVVDSNDCGVHSHQPRPAQVEMVTAMFADAPVANPDGSIGIHMVHDYGQGGLFTGGNRLADDDGAIAGGVGGRDFAAHKAANFALEREGYFHYVLMLHHYDTDSRSSGQAELGHDDMIVSLQCAVDRDAAVAHTIAHELGHNLNLHHGGAIPFPNYKPNYNSIMNYRYQFPGADGDCTPPGDGVMDFSYGTRPDLDENDLDEADGICGADGPPWDWNGDGDTADTGLALDINVDFSGEGDGQLGVLSDYDDWANIVLTGVNQDGDGVSLRTTTEVVSCQPVPDRSGHRGGVR